MWLYGSYKPVYGFMHPAQLRDDMFARVDITIDHPVVPAVQKNHKVVRFGVRVLRAQESFRLAPIKKRDNIVPASYLRTVRQ